MISCVEEVRYRLRNEPFFPSFESLLHSDAALHDRRQWLREVAAKSQELLNEGVPIRDFMAAFQGLREALLKSVFESTISRDLRERLVYVRFGSAGRGEDLLASDLDHAIILRDPLDTSIFLPELQRFIGRMNEFGCPVCQGFVMGTNPRWIGTREEWLKRIQGYFLFPDWENVRYLFISLDGRPLYGDTDDWDAIHEVVFNGIRKSPFICWEMAHLGIHKSVALNLFGRVRVQTGSGTTGLNIKEGLLTPILHCVRLFAVADGYHVSSTWQRIRHLRTRNLVPENLLDRVEAAVEFGFFHRLRKQIDDVLAGREPSDLVVLGTSFVDGWRVQEPIKEDWLRHLETAKELERLTHRKFPKPR